MRVEVIYGADPHLTSRTDAVPKLTLDPPRMRFAISQYMITRYWFSHPYTKGSNSQLSLLRQKLRGLEPVHIA